MKGWWRLMPQRKQPRSPIGKYDCAAEKKPATLAKRKASQWKQSDAAAKKPRQELGKSPLALVAQETSSIAFRIFVYRVLRVCPECRNQSGHFLRRLTLRMRPRRTGTRFPGRFVLPATPCREDSASSTRDQSSWDLHFPLPAIAHFAQRAAYYTGGH